MPAEEGIGRDQGVQVTEYPSPEALGLCGQAPALGVGEPETARTELLSADAILFLERVNDVTLLLVDPARDGHDEELKHLGKRRHTGASRAAALGGHERRDPASVQRRISPSDGVDRVLGQYELKVSARSLAANISGSSHKCVHDSAPAGRPRRGKRVRMRSCQLTSGEVVCRSVDGRLRGPRF